ncbi:hypothetical protein F4559_006016 [Saccharothrix violaceirubra]|uniref:Uncharacterized protein n=1 Tax=Saccharothrix violaceirubra TaxID=413306 RepID=A0A7W7WYW4_9PSEU|nr:hypothetical protein [Saccharothrix violaceirubra]
MALPCPADTIRWQGGEAVAAADRRAQPTLAGRPRDRPDR